MTNLIWVIMASGMTFGIMLSIQAAGTRDAPGPRFGYQMLASVIWLLTTLAALWLMPS